MNDRKFSLKAEHVLRCAQAAAGELATCFPMTDTAIKDTTGVCDSEAI